LLFAIGFPLAVADIFAFTAEDLALAFAFFGAGFSFFDFLEAAFLVAMRGV
jgi:hypothetical protein